MTGNILCFPRSNDCFFRQLENRSDAVRTIVSKANLLMFLMD